MGKTKNVFVEEDCVKLQFKDNACGVNGVFDPGANQVAGIIEGKGAAGCDMSTYLFKRLEVNGIRTHYVSTEGNVMTCRKLQILPVEWIWRARAWGSFCRTYGRFASKGAPLHGLIETTLKDDELGDPRINREALLKLEILTMERYDVCEKITRKVGTFLQNEFQNVELELIDFKLEFGIDVITGELLVGDEISGDIMRVLDKKGEQVSPVALRNILLNPT